MQEKESMVSAENPSFLSKPDLVKPGERIENGIWRPEFFDLFKDQIVVGASTEILKKDTSKQTVASFLRDKERATTPLKEKIGALRILLEFLKRLDPNIDAHNLIKPELAHTNNIVVVDEEFISNKEKTEKETGKKLLIPQTDGLVSNLKNIPLIISGGDCPPVIIFDPVNNALGLYHSSRESTLAGISENIVGKMIEKYGSIPKDLKVIIGPSISQKNYPVGITEFNKSTDKYSPEELTEIFDQKEDQYFMDISKAIGISLDKLGLDEKNIFVSKFCTYSDKGMFPSARRDREFSDRFLITAMLK